MSEGLSRVLLASASPRRLHLLQSLGVTVEIAPSGYEEPIHPRWTPAQVALDHAAQKLDAVLRRGVRPMPVLAADTVVDVDGEALGKPVDAHDAVRMLGRLSGRAHLVHTAFALASGDGRRREAECVTTTVRFYELQPEEIREYVATDEPLDKAGAYGIAGRGAALVERVEGDFYAVMGLPLGRVVRALRRLGFRLPNPK
ncbi:MAG: septum formation protein Maf [Candidatus Eremiobacteraeota bacterium]|nr:septum formation protein Maf [Candidatus Eremiobacteraeota bacterium]MBV9699198.1 septum formation protein Maf [Candidatus Eremiobacteraeota bacterium]